MTRQTVRPDAATGQTPTSGRPSRRSERSPRTDARRQRRARQISYIGCAGALGYGVVKLVSIPCDRGDGLYAAWSSRSAVGTVLISFS